MKLYFLLIAVLLQGARGQDFIVKPRTENVVQEGESLTLECITQQNVSYCAWKLKDVELLPSGFLFDQLQTQIEWGITAREPNSTTDCSIVIENVTNRHSGEYICSPYFPVGQIDTESAEVIVAQKPAAVAFSGESAGLTELEATAQQPVNVTCEARDARPRATLHWYLGDHEIYDGIQVGDETDPGSKLVTSRSTLTRQFDRADDGMSLRCEAHHVGYTEDDIRHVELTVLLRYAPYRPEGSDLGTLYGFTEGENGTVRIHFTANPEPTVMVWTVSEGRELGAEQLSEDARFSTGPLEPQTTGEHQYSLRLDIRPVQPEDKDAEFALRLGNDVGEETLRFRLGTGAPPPPPPSPQPPAAAAEGGIGGGAIAAIVLVVLALLLVIGLIALARSRGKCCFAVKSGKPGAEASDTESAHDEKTDKPEKTPFKLSNLYSSLVTKKKKDADVELANSQEETKELTGPDTEASPKREQPEVVYAELVLDKDGVKTELRPSPEKTEYAVIVGTKTPEDGNKE